MTGILILILRCLKEENQWTWYLLSVYFKIGFLNFSNIYCWYILELPLSNLHLQHMSIQYMSVALHKTGVSQTCQLLFMFQCNEDVEMNKFSFQV